MPDNVKCCQYYSNVDEKDEAEVLRITIGSETFDQIMRKRLQENLGKLIDLKRGKKDRVFEVMAGTGRNFSVLREFFENVEQLE